MAASKYSAPKPSKGRTKRQSNPLDDTDLIRREDIIEACRDSLAGPRRTPIAIFGEHGSGKTALLHWLDDTSHKEQWGHPHTDLCFIYVECSTIKPFTPANFWQCVLQNLIQAHYNPNLSDIVDKLLLLKDIGQSHFKSLCDWLTQQRLSLVLLLDEFDAVFYTPDMDAATKGSFLSRLRAFQESYPACATLVTSTRDPLERLYSRTIRERHTSPFFNVFYSVPMRPFSSDEMGAMLKQVRNRTGVACDPADHALLARLSGGNPKLLQEACRCLVKERRQAPLTRQSAEKVVQEFEAIAGRQYFDLFWQRSTSQEQTILALILLSYLGKRSLLEFDEASEPTATARPAVRKRDSSSIEQQLAEARQNLGLVQERIAEFVVSTDVPLQVRKEERRLLDEIASLERQLAAQPAEDSGPGLRPEGPESLSEQLQDMHTILHLYEPELSYLTNRGLIQKVTGNTYQIASTSFAKWIVRRLAREDRSMPGERHPMSFRWVWQALREQTSGSNLGRLLQALNEPLLGNYGSDDT
jgi:BMFP domain-containing protein YqiC